MRRLALALVLAALLAVPSASALAGLAGQVDAAVARVASAGRPSDVVPDVAPSRFGCALDLDAAARLAIGGSCGALVPAGRDANAQSDGHAVTIPLAGRVGLGVDPVTCDVTLPVRDAADVTFEGASVAPALIIVLPEPAASSMRALCPLAPDALAAARQSASAGGAGSVHTLGVAPGEDNAPRASVDDAHLGASGAVAFDARYQRALSFDAADALSRLAWTRGAPVAIAPTTAWTGSASGSTSGAPVEPRRDGAFPGDAPSSPHGAPRVREGPDAAPTHARAAAVASVATAAMANALWSLLTGRTRTHARNALEQGTRRRVYDALAARPGRTAQELAGELRLERTLVQYHLRQLVRTGLLVARTARRRTRYAPVGVRVDVLAEDVLATPAARRVAETVRASSGVSFSEICKATGLSTSLVAYHVRALCQAGLLKRDPGAARDAAYRVTA